MQDQPTLEEVLKLVEQLSPDDKRRLVERVAPKIEQRELETPLKPRRSARGILADLGPAPSAEEIDEARREAWSGRC